MDVPAPPLAEPDQDWRTVEVAGWGAVGLAEYYGWGSLCLVVGPDQRQVLILAGTLSGDDLIRVAEGLRLNG